MRRTLDSVVQLVPRPVPDVQRRRAPALSLGIFIRQPVPLAGEAGLEQPVERAPQRLVQHSTVLPLAHAADPLEPGEDLEQLAIVSYASGAKRTISSPGASTRKPLAM